MPPTIAIQGQLGSFHHGVATTFFGDDITLLCQPTFRDAFEALDTGAADYCVAAIENTLHGTIIDTLDLVARYDIHIIGEHIEHIEQQLIGFQGTNLEDIREVSSHFAALNQCREYLQTHLPHAEVIEHHDTAGAVADIKSRGDRHAAAIAGVAAAAYHNMPILAANIEDEKDNFTRFFIASKHKHTVPEANKASLILTTSHQSGALYRALGVLERYGVNLTKLESRPIRGHAFRYQFFVDVEINAVTLSSATRELEAQSCDVTLLGHYRAAR